MLLEEKKPGGGGSFSDRLKRGGGRRPMGPWNTPAELEKKAKI